MLDITAQGDIILKSNIPKIGLHKIKGAKMNTCIFSVKLNNSMTLMLKYIVIQRENFGQIVRKRKTGLTVSTRVERILPDTVAYVVKQNIMLPVFLRIFKIRPNPLNLKIISIYTD